MKLVISPLPICINERADLPSLFDGEFLVDRLSWARVHDPLLRPYVCRFSIIYRFDRLFLRRSLPNKMLRQAYKGLRPFPHSRTSDEA